MNIQVCCVCVSERGSQRGREREREQDRNISVCMGVCHDILENEGERLQQAPLP